MTSDAHIKNQRRLHRQNRCASADDFSRNLNWNSLSQLWSTPLWTWSRYRYPNSHNDSSSSRISSLKNALVLAEKQQIVKNSDKFAFVFFNGFHLAK